MSIKLSWRTLSQATATTVLGIAMLAASGTSKANAVDLRTFNLSGTFGDTLAQGTLDLRNGSFDGTYTVDVDQLPPIDRTVVRVENFDINLRNFSGVARGPLSSSEGRRLNPRFPDLLFFPTGRIFRALFSSSPTSFPLLEFSTPSESIGTVTRFQLRLTDDFDFTGTNIGLNDGTVYGSYGSIAGGSIDITSFESEPVPEPFTIGGTAVAGAMGLWLKRKKQKSS